MKASMSRSQPLAHEIEAKRLGNPAVSLYESNSEPPFVFRGVAMVASSQLQIVSNGLPNKGETLFSYQRDSTRFDSGCLILVKYERNEDDSQNLSLENKLLQHKAPLSVGDFHSTILPEITPISTYVTHVRFQTRGAKVHVEVEDMFSLFDIPFNYIPPDLALHIPRVLISELEKDDTFMSHHTFIKVVHYNRAIHVFKHHGTYYERTVPQDALLPELRANSSLSSPFVVPISHIVVDNARGRFRGFLQSYLPAGSLRDVIRRMQRQNVRGASFTGRKTKEKYLLQSVPLQISWAVKLAWCIDMARALNDLHTRGIAIGCVSLENFLLDTDGHIKLIDIAPYEGFHPFYSAPEIEVGADVSTRDVFSLGIVMWVLALEYVDFGRDNIMDAPKIFWTDTPGSPPQWFRTMIPPCLNLSPGNRPLMSNILTTLLSDGQIPTSVPVPVTVDATDSEDPTKSESEEI